MGSPKFESPLPHKKAVDNTLNVNGFSFIKNYCAKIAPMKYKGLKLVKGKRYYVEYYYKIPEELSEKFNNEEWKRFRMYENINRLRGLERDREAQILLASVKFALDEEDFNPFKHQDKYFSTDKEKVLNATELINFFIDNIGERSLDKDTSSRYINTSKLLLSYLQSKGKQLVEPSKLDAQLILECLLHFKTANSWSNRQFNNILNYLSIMFNFLKSKKKIVENPCEEIKPLRSISKKHRYYDDKTLSLVLGSMRENDPYLYTMAQFVYYAGIRSSKELINLQVRDLLIDRNRMRLRGEGTKGNREDYILLDPKLKEVIDAAGIMNYPDEHYIFTYHLQPHESRSSDEFIQKRFRKLRNKLKLSEDYTLYSFKHTRAVHLLMDGAEPVDIMQLFRHRDLTATTKYIRDLGFDLNAKFTEKSRAI